MERVKGKKHYHKLLEKGEGIIYNDFSPSGAQGELNILHRAYCRTLNQSSLTVDKYFSNSLREAEEWLDRHRGEDWRKCMSCFGIRGNPRVYNITITLMHLGGEFNYANI